LQNVLRRWARRSPEIVETVKELVQGAKEMTESAQSGDLDRLGMCLGQYWEQKKKMAGKDSGVEPVVVEQVLSKLRNEREIDGGTLCGAGGGGFLALLARKGRNSGDLQTWIESHKGLFHADVNLFSWHKCAVCNEGLATQTVTSSNSDSFDIRWHNVTS
jgi:fucokinase